MTRIFLIILALQAAFQIRQKYIIFSSTWIIKKETSGADVWVRKEGVTDTFIFEFGFRFHVASKSFTIQPNLGFHAEF